MKKNDTLKNVIMFCGIFLMLLVSCKDYRIRRNNSFDHIEFLKENILLVRLKSADNKIKLLKSNQNQARVNEEIQKIKIENSEIMKAFENHFDFCKVYFFLPKEARSLRKGNFDKVTLFNSKNTAVSDKSILRNGFLVSAFGAAYADEFIYEDRGYRGSAGGTNSFPALVIMDQDYIRLKRPFPSRIPLNSVNRKKSEAVKELNKELYNFYHKSKIKKAKLARRKQRD